MSQASDDRKFAQMSIDEARKSISENDGRAHPKVGAVVVKDGRVLSTAHRGEQSGNHAEFVALEKKLSDEAVAGATVYTTLEPCTTRNHPKIPCVERLIERRVARVVIGMLDPDMRITGRGQIKLRAGGIATDFFPPDLMSEVEELNREFIRFCQKNVALRRKHTKTDQSLVLFEIKRLTYKFEALDFQEERRALEIMRQVLLFGRFSSHEVKEDCVSFVYETASWLMRGMWSKDFGWKEFVSHQTSILMECSPIITLVAPSRRPLTKKDIELLKHIINVAGDIAYSVCKYIQNEQAAHDAILALHDLLRFSVLNNLTDCEKEVLDEFAQCERISLEGNFEPALKHLDFWKKEALTYRHKNNPKPQHKP